jgi:hypothetical protein
VSIASPGNGSVVSGVVTVDVTAFDGGGVSRVELLADGVLIGTDTLAPFSFSWDSTRRSDGAATIQARAVDSSGNSSSAQISVTVRNDLVAPSVTILNPANGSTVSGTVSVQISASDNQAVKSLALVIDGKTVASVSGGSLTYSWTVCAGGKGRKATVCSGTATLKATATDAGGNAGSATVSVTKTR